MCQTWDWRFPCTISICPHNTPVTWVSLSSFDRKGSWHRKSQGHPASGQWNRNLNPDLPADSKGHPFSATAAPPSGQGLSHRGGNRLSAGKGSDPRASPWQNADQSSGLWAPHGTWGADSRLSKCHCEQGIRPPLGEQRQGLNELLLQLVDSGGLWLWPREAVELGISVLEGPVVSHCRAEARA